MKNQDRSQDHKRNLESEQLMADLNELLKTPNDQAVVDLPESPHPNIYILGCPRSGTTFVHQLLINSFEVAYPSNFLSRFYYAPYIGAKIQYLLCSISIGNCDYNLNNLINLSSFSSQPMDKIIFGM